MRVTSSPDAGPGPARRPSGGFDAALRRAREEGARQAPACRDARPGSTDGALALLRRGRAATGLDPDAADAGATAAATPALAQAGDRLAPAVGPVAELSELRAAVRALPAAIEAAGLAGGAPLRLAFGDALAVDLVRGPAGLELRLQPTPRLARAAQAELPALVRALRERGLAVARAEVTPRGGRGAREEPPGRPPAR
jgi:hypothetical protein